ncbi:MAG: nucleotide exchange factor GrpE [bacterium]|nr:nucleotide exchange factor GrpE [bacterium]MDE0289248.1 nucleotide exchange factor GrpE [bacterium]MDE0438108.1 nucleotide exchange factor GrpE [bacterium]
MTGEHGEMTEEGLAEDEDGAAAEESAEAVPAFELPEDPDEAIALLISELLATRAAAAEAIDKWKRSVAEFDNYRKRAQRDQAAMIARASERVLGRLLPVLDSLDAAMGMDTRTSSDENIRRGLTGTRDLLLSTLAREGLEPIEALGEVFDPNVHEAAQMGEGSGTMVVAAEWRRGYTLNGRVIRASLVAVGYEAARTEETAAEDQAEE